MILDKIMKVTINHIINKKISVCITKIYLFDIHLHRNKFNQYIKIINKR